MKLVGGGSDINTATPSSLYVIHSTNCIRQEIQCLHVAGFFSKSTILHTSKYAVVSQRLKFFLLANAHVDVFFVAVDKSTENQFSLDLVKVGPKIIGRGLKWTYEFEVRYKRI